MLFNSYPFIFVFLPVALLVFFLVGRINHLFAAGWLAAASLFFYAWWNPAYVGLLLMSIMFNYLLGIQIAKAGIKQKAAAQKQLLIFAIFINLAALSYYKYANFFLNSINGLTGSSWGVGDIILPIGISFFTFTQIAFLVDTYQGKVKEYNLVHYGLFVTYFPHLIAGPVLHHKEMMPQFARASTYKLNYENISVGLTIFFFGLFKKVILADGVAAYVAPVFDVAGGGNPSFIEAWGGALAYTLQLYFDFSGYSDMAIGLSRLFGITLPLNFHSPYKAINIIDFWRRWHMTLSRFLRDYLYIPLGGSRKGPVRRYANLMTTMLLGGLWHGAGWTFVIWGGLHGIYLVINHGWHTLRLAMGHDLTRSSWWGRISARGITLIAVVVAWVFFRAKDLDSSLAILKGMAGVNGLVFPELWMYSLGWVGQMLMGYGIKFGDTGAFAGSSEFVWIALLTLVVLFMPNTQQIMDDFKPVLDMPQEKQSAWPIQWQPSMMWVTGLVVLATWSFLNLSKVSEFLYFQF